MNQQDKILRTGFALFSAITSFVFVFYTVRVLGSGTASEWLKAFAYVVGGYGLMNIYILSWAWRSCSHWAPSVNLVMATCFLGVVVMDLIREGLKDGMQLAGILGLAVVLGINWLAVKTLCQPEISKKGR